MKRRNHQRTSAFTLVEILVALGILGLVLAAIYSSWTAVLRASKVGLDTAAQVQRQRIAMRTLEEALNSTRSFALDLQHYGFVAENGREANLSFVARLPKSFPRSGKFGDLDVRRVTFSIEPGEDSARNLVLRQNSIVMDLDEDEQGHPLVLAKNVKDLIVQFWDMRQNDWADEWTQTNQLPKMVKITLRMGGADPRSERVESEVTRIVALPSVMVQPMWQTPNLQGGAPGQPGGATPLPVQPGNQPKPPSLQMPGVTPNPSMPR